MRILRYVIIAGALSSMAAQAADREFKDIVAAISDEFHTQPMHIPFFGLVNVVTFVARPAGTKHIELAVFENLNDRDRDGRDLAQSVRRAVGAAWKPFVQVWSQKPGHDETTLIYMRMDGKDCRFLVTNIEPNEATVVELKLNPDALQKWLLAPQTSARFHWNHDRERDE